MKTLAISDRKLFDTIRDSKLSEQFSVMFAESFDFESPNAETLAKSLSPSLEIQIRTVARTVRQWCEERDNAQPCPTGDLEGWCAIAAVNVWLLLHKQGITSDIHYWENALGFHAYNVVEDFVVDVTATQFSQYRNQPIVIIHKRLAEVNMFHQTSHIFDTAKDLIAYQRKIKVVSEQQAFEYFV